MERPLDSAVKLENLPEEIAGRWPDQVPGRILIHKTAFV
jgi:hypothetical protein